MRFVPAILILALSGCSLFREPLSPLIVAARSGDVTEIGRLAGVGADVNAPGGVNNWTPLMHAIHKNQAQAVVALLEAGADANAVSGRTTALIMAAGYGQADVVRILLDHGAKASADALAAAVGGSTDFDDYTAGRCQVDTVRALLVKDPALTLPGDSIAIETARRGGCTDVVALLAK